jgi:cytochrome c biogenesis factor
MELESVLLITSAIFLVIDIVIVGRNKVKLKQSIWGFYACLLSFALIAIAYISFLAGFLSSDFSLVQVYSYTASSMPIISKLYATWAGSAGSILLLILFTSVAWFSIRAYGYKKQTKQTWRRAS